MIGPFKPTAGGFWYVYIAIDKFSKCIEYKPLVSATAKNAVELFEDIIFGTSTKTNASPSNTSLLPVLEPNQVKWVNGMILDALKKRLY